MRCPFYGTALCRSLGLRARSRHAVPVMGWRIAGLEATTRSVAACRPRDGMAHSGAGSDYALFSARRPCDGTAHSRAGSDYALFSARRPRDGMAHSGAGSDYVLFSARRPRDGTAHSGAGSDYVLGHILSLALPFARLRRYAPSPVVALSPTLRRPRYRSRERSACGAAQV